MPALIESFASRRIVAWHGLGTVFEEDEVTTSEMLDLANLAGWDVRLRPVETDARATSTVFEVLRTNPTDGETDRLGFVGERYTVVQNEDAFAFADNILHGGGRWETAGSLRDGAVVFGSLALDHEMVIDPTGVADIIHSYLLISTSHDGSTSVQGSVTPVRVVCANTLNMALRSAKQSYKIRHTQSVDGRVIAAREALGLAHKYLDTFEAEATALFETEMTKVTFEKIVKGLFPEPEIAEAKGAKAARTRWETKFDTIMGLWTAETQTGITGTAWGAVNTLTEFNQWNRNVRDGNMENALAAGAGFDPVTNQFRTQVLNAVKAYA